MVLKPTLEKKASEILPEIEIDLLARALSVDVFESICSKSDIGLCADKARSLGDLSNEALFEEPPLLTTESCKSESSLSDASFSFDEDRCSETSSPLVEEQPDCGKVFPLTHPLCIVACFGGFLRQFLDNLLLKVVLASSGEADCSLFNEALQKMPSPPACEVKVILTIILIINIIIITTIITSIICVINWALD